jgi:hypothetical protein
MSTEARVRRLLGMVAALEETIIRLEQRQEGLELRETIVRLRVMQGEILAALHQLEGDFPRVD